MRFVDNGSTQRAATTGALPWSQAWYDANTGETGFYRNNVAESQFRTSVHVDNSVATAIATLIQPTLATAPDDFTVIDIGSGSGQLLMDLAPLLPTNVSYLGVDIRERPGGLPDNVAWIQQRIDETTEDITGCDGHITGVVIAHEFLDDIPCDVVELDDDLQPRLVLVDSASGAEEIGPQLCDPACARFIAAPTDALQWLNTWWPPTQPLARREIGLPRDHIWDRLKRVLCSGTSVAIDYGHRRAERARGLWDGGTLKGFSNGRVQRPIPNGSVNITSHVALDSCAGAHARLSRQSEHVSPSTTVGFALTLGAFDWLVEPIVTR